MKQYENPLFDYEFLKQLDNQNNREIFARVIALTFQETPVETIEGRVTSGSINIDGASAVRRTCSLSMIAKDLDINSFYWGVKTKFKLEIGLKNTINPIYPDIIWFPQGVYVITSFNTSQSTNNFTVSISGKDKMCLLNGDLGGNLPASIDFGTQEFVDKEKNITTYKKITLKNIIKEALHAYALEPYHNIIINDLDEAGLELLEYRGEDPIYLLYNVKTNEYVNLKRKKDENTIVYLCSFNKATKKYEVRTYVDDEDNSIKPLTSALKDIKYTSRIDKILLSDNDADIFVDEVEQDKNTGHYYIPENKNIYMAAKIEYGQTAGYRITELVYAGELISSIGESLTSILDKIKNMLGEFEYFYDLDGRFVFQRKKIYLNRTFNGEKRNDEYRCVENSAYNSKVIYNFEGGNLITSYQNNPNLQNLKNDYSIWGVRKLVSGEELLIHFRYAIDIKPEKYTSILITEEDVNELKAFSPETNFKTQKSVTYTIDEYDWREIIYRMALDYYKYGQLNDFAFKIIEANAADGLYIDGTTGYEQYYIDLQGFWRDLYDPEPDVVYPPVDKSIQENEAFIADQNRFPMGVYTNYKYEKWAPGLADKEEILVLTNHQITVKDEEGNNKTNEDGSFITQDSRWELHSLLDEYEFEFTYTAEEGKEVNDLTEVNENFYISCGLSKEYPDGKKKVAKGIAPFVQKKELLQKIDIVETEDNQVSTILNEDGSSSYLWKYYGDVYEAYPDRNEKGEIIMSETDDKKPATFHTYIKLIDIILQNDYNEKESLWYYKVSKEKEFYPIYQLQEDGSIVSWAIDVGLENLYFPDYNANPNRLYTYIPHSQYNFFGVYDLTIAAEPEKRYIDYYKADYEYYLKEADSDQKYWNKMVKEAPDTLNFWFDFLEEGELDQFSIQAVGDRTKVVNDKDVKSIYFRDVPEIIFIDMSVKEESQRDLELIDISDYWHFTRIRNIPMHLFNISAQGKSAQDELEGLLYNHAYCTESITIQSLPIYYLEPNTRIFVRDDSSKINGEYIVSRLTIPLAYNGTMSISATKAPTRLY